MVLNPALETPPLDPDAPEAQRWLQDELSKPEYVSARAECVRPRHAVDPRLVRRACFEGASGIPGPLLALLVLVVVVVLVVVGLLVFGLPATATTAAESPSRCSTTRTAATSRALRRAAAAAAEAGDWPLAIEERYRAIVRGIVDRDLVRVHPGTTAAASRMPRPPPFPAHADALRSAAADFDAVRYLGAIGLAARTTTR